MPGPGFLNSPYRHKSKWRFTQFKTGVWQGQFSASYDETSDLACPQKSANSAYLWAVDDGILTKVLAFNRTTAAIAGEWTITGFTGVDVECLTSFTKAGQAYLVIGDTGDNASARSTFQLCRVKEPTITGSNGTISAPDVEVIVCQFPGGNVPSLKDVECMFADTLTGDLYLVTKRISPILLYRLPYAASYSGTQTLEYMGALTSDTTLNTISDTPSGNNGYVTGGCMSQNGEDIVLRSYTTFYGWKRRNRQSVITALQRAPDWINSELVIGLGFSRISPYGEPQGEAVCFDETGEYLFHTSELTASNNYQNPPLVRLPRVDSGAIVKATFQQGFSSYTGCTDTYIDQAVPGTSNAAALTLIADYDFSAYPTTSNIRMGLVKFDISSIPSTAIVVDAFLDMYCAVEGKGAQLHRMLVSWSDTSTWTSLSGGVSLDGSDAVATASCVIGDATGESAFIDAKTGLWRFPLPAADVQGWINGGHVNQGYVITGRFTDTTGDGVQLTSSKEATNASRRPKLTIQYYVP